MLEMQSLVGTAGDELALFIMLEIDPYLSIPLEDKMSISIYEYGDKLVSKADGFVAIDSGKIIGVVGGYIRNRREEDSVYLSIFGVSAEKRGDGLGTDLLRKFISNVPANCSVYTTVDEGNDVAWKVYQKAGFFSKRIVAGRRYIEYPNRDLSV